ncbi:tRNA pseudouridine synthase 1, partial [Teratosphaeriaceae sp. CCFEE 6253]
FLAKKLEEYADECGDREGYESRQEKVKGFWEGVDGTAIREVLEGIDEDIRYDVIRALQGEDEAGAKTVKGAADLGTSLVRVGSAGGGGGGGNGQKETGDGEAQEEIVEVKNDSEKTEEAAIILQPELATLGQDAAASAPAENIVSVDGVVALVAPAPASAPPRRGPSEADLDRTTRLRTATKLLRAAYTTAKRRYRIPPSRISRIQSALTRFVGTSNYHNYTVQKTYRDPSAKRHIKSFVVEKTPILIGEGVDAGDKSEWLSLKIHGQSFMMHQIRKMIGMVCLLVRSGSSLSTLGDSLGPERYSIPKVPGLGLLLERPVFDSYNALQAEKHGRERLLFSKFEEDIKA